MDLLIIDQFISDVMMMIIKVTCVLSDAETQCEVMQEIVDLILEVSSLIYSSHTEITD